MKSKLAAALAAKSEAHRPQKGVRFFSAGAAYLAFFLAVVACMVAAAAVASHDLPLTLGGF